jgi:phosphoenolpyruvate phosphomutase
MEPKQAGEDSGLMREQIQYNQELGLNPLRRHLKRGGLPIAGIHNPLSALLAEEAGFEALWLSGFGHSAQAGVRDADELTWVDLADSVERITDVSALPLLVDGDAGFGDFNTARRAAYRIAQRGAAGLCIEDKPFPKTNSFCGTHRLEERSRFVSKIKAIKDRLSAHDFVLVARTETLIVGGSMEEALDRAESYVDAGADAVLIHSKSSSNAEVLEFQRRFSAAVPLLVVPTTYPLSLTEGQRFSGVIWANQLLRASVKAMREAARQLIAGEAHGELSTHMASMEDIFKLQKMGELFEARARFESYES